MGWLADDGSHRGQVCQAWTAVGLPPRHPLLLQLLHGHPSRPLPNCTLRDSCTHQWSQCKSEAQKCDWLCARLDDVDEDGLVLVSDWVSADERAMRLGGAFFSLILLHDIPRSNDKWYAPNNENYSHYNCSVLSTTRFTLLGLYRAMGPPGGLRTGCCIRATSTPKVTGSMFGKINKYNTKHIYNTCM